MENSDDRLNKAVSKGFIIVMTIVIFIIWGILNYFLYKEGTLSLRGMIYSTITTTLLFCIVFYLRSCISVLEKRLYELEKKQDNFGLF